MDETLIPERYLSSFITLSSFYVWLFLLLKQPQTLYISPFPSCFKCSRVPFPLTGFHLRVKWLLCASFLSPLQFKVDGEWWTWIDYERFQELIRIYEETGGQWSFSALDYMAKTPSWALFGAKEQGFDPADTRFQRRSKTKDISGCWDAKEKAISTEHKSQGSKGQFYHWKKAFYLFFIFLFLLRKANRNSVSSSLFVPSFSFLSATGPEDCTVDVPPLLFGVFKTVAPSPSDLMRPNEVPSESDGFLYVKMYPDVNVYQSCNKWI